MILLWESKTNLLHSILVHESAIINVMFPVLLDI